jgi:drug/metabolite transporter (DMT)-like permease
MNYLVCLVLGFIFSSPSTSGLLAISSSGWWFWPLILGVIFLGNFFLTGLTVERMGITVSSVSTKISLVIPFFASILLHNGKGLGITSGLGLIFCCLSIWLVSQKESSSDSTTTISGWWLPVSIFLGTGITDALSQWCNETQVPMESQPMFVMLVFAGAFLASLPFFLKSLSEGRNRLSSKIFLAGFLLGLPNFFSYYFVLKALDDFDNQGNIVFPVANLGVILVTGLVSYFYFRDSFSRQNLLGILFSFLSLLLLLN